MVTVRHGKATLEVTFQFQEGEFPGDYIAEFQSAELETLCESYGIDIMDSDFQDGDSETVNITFADAVIQLLEAMDIEGGTYHIAYYGNPYWFFHDMHHAKHDCHGGAIDVNEHSEHRALWQGAILAREHGVKLGLIFRALSSAETGYRERFQCETSALEDFADWLDKEHAQQYNGV